MRWFILYEPLITDASKKYGNNRWLVYSNKLKRDVYLFSDLEYEHWLQVETDSYIVDFCEQPVKMEVLKNNKLQYSIVDMWVKYKNGKQLFIEIKYSKDLLKDKVKKQIDIQKVWCEAQQKNHLIKTEKEIKINSIHLSNLKLIIKKVNKSLETNHEVINLINCQINSQPKTVQQVHFETKIEYNELFNTICILLYKGEIKSDLSFRYLSKSTEVWK